MKRRSFLFLIVCSFTLFLCVDCKRSSSGSTADSETTLSEEGDETSLPELKADEQINKATRFYAGISKEGVSMSDADSKAWDTYSNDIKSYIQMSKKTCDGVDSIARTDFSDFRDKVDYVFYPFSGADFVYPITLFPDADTYFLCGLEKTGAPINENIKTDASQYQAYRKALTTFFRSSFFVTKAMKDDLHNDELDGVCPVITMLMAIEGYDIISIKYKTLNEQGEFMDTDKESQILEFKFFRPGTRHEQTLYYISGDVSDGNFNANLKAYLDHTLPKHTVGTYLKAASYLLHDSYFAKMRKYILDYSMAVVQDDSGMPYHYFVDQFDVTLYGKYIHPLSCFDEKDYQKDLDEKYKEDAANVHALPFRIGYNNPSNWLCARRKKSK